MSDTPVLPDGFNPKHYLQLNPDVAAAGADPVKHWLRHGRDEGRPWKKQPCWNMSTRWQGFDGRRGKYEVINFCIAHCAIEVPISESTIVLEVGAKGAVPNVSNNRVLNCFEHRPEIAAYRAELAAISGLTAARDFLKAEAVPRDSLVNFTTYRLFNLPFKLSNTAAQPHMNFVSRSEALEFRPYICYERCDFPYFLGRSHLSRDVEHEYKRRHGAAPLKPGIDLVALHMQSAEAEGVLTSHERVICENNLMHLTSLGCGHLPVGIFCDVIDAAAQATLRFLRDHQGKSFAAGRFQIALVGFERIVNFLLERVLLAQGRALSADDFGCWTLISEDDVYVPGALAP